ncbi:MGDG synthase family glycosyltransferase [Thermomicrobium sp.]
MVLSEWLLVGLASTFAAAGGVAQRQQRLRHLQRVTRSLAFPDGSPRVLILSASIGGGHNAAAAVLRHDLERLGSQVRVLDGFALATPLLSRYFAWVYPFQLRYTPFLYELQFRSSHRRTWTRIWRRIYAGLGGAAFHSLIEELQPDVVVSTYPLVTQALGVLRSTGRLLSPVVATVTDYGVHRLWIAPGVDLHLVPSRVSAEQVADATGDVRVMQPLVREAFRQSRNRAAVRHRYGLAPDDFVALVVAGAWGIGHVELIVRDVVDCGVRVIVVCGKNQELAERLRREYAGCPSVQVWGWTDQLPELMTAADCLIQNAGGLTCLEAIACGLPVLMYRPIAGHGVFNAAAMERAGAARWIRSVEELRMVLRGAAAGRIRLPVPKVDEDAVPAAEAILALVADRDARIGASRTFAPQLVRTGSS